jgi:hypothetical protein
LVCPAAAVSGQGTSTTDILASAEIVEFFQNYQLP